MYGWETWMLHKVEQNNLLKEKIGGRFLTRRKMKIQKSGVRNNEEIKELYLKSNIVGV